MTQFMLQRLRNLSIRRSKCLTGFFCLYFIFAPPPTIQVFVSYFVFVFALSSYFVSIPLCSIFFLSFFNQFFFCRLFVQDDSCFLFSRDERHDVSTQIEGQPNVMEGTKCRVCGEGELALRARWIGCDREDREKM